MANNQFKIIQSLKQYLMDLKSLDPDMPVFCENLQILEKLNIRCKKNEESKSISLPDNLEKIAEIIKTCKKCPLSKSRIKAVPGEGNPKARVMFIGEGPGYEEDHTGRPFVGRAGQLLTKIIESIGLKREEVFITNIVKCHPMIDPENPHKHGNDRPPSQYEVTACLPYLEKQIEIIKPEVIITLGSPASKTILSTTEQITKLRGNIYYYKNIKVIPTYHPSALLRNPDLKRPVWEDMKLLRSTLQENAK